MKNKEKMTKIAKNLALVGAGVAISSIFWFKFGKKGSNFVPYVNLDLTIGKNPLFTNYEGQKSDQNGFGNFYLNDPGIKISDLGLLGEEICKISAKIDPEKSLDRVSVSYNY